MQKVFGKGEFGVGWRHPHYAELLENPSIYSGESELAVDFLEVHSENFFGAGGAARAVLQQARKHWPISLHGVGLGLGSAVGIDPWHLDQLVDLVDRTDPMLVSDHACFARGEMPHFNHGDVVHAADLLPIPFSQEALNVLCSNVAQVQDRLARPLAVENLSAYFTWQDADYSETQFLTELTQRTGCKLLVDVNNIYVNALNAAKACEGAEGTRFGRASDPLHSCLQWLDQIPVGAVTELHLAGHNAMNDIVIDDHSCAVNEAVWLLYRRAKQRFADAHTLVEWDTDIPAFSVLLDQLQQAKREAGGVNP